MPYTPNESIAAFKYFYHNYGQNLWGPYGFKDAFNLQHNWFASSFLAIDQGPIIIMVENYRSQLLWNKFMANPEIQPMLDSIGFVYDPSSVNDGDEIAYKFELVGNYPNPFNPSTTIKFILPNSQQVNISVYDVLGRKIKNLISTILNAGTNEIRWDGKNDYSVSVTSGMYIYKIQTREGTITGKMMLLK
jgi:hypothetical protein